MPTLREVITREMQKASIEAQAFGISLLPMVLDGCLTEAGIDGEVLDERYMDVTIELTGETLYRSCECRDARFGICAHQYALMKKYVDTPSFFRDAPSSPRSEMPAWRRVPRSTEHLEDRLRHMAILDHLRVSDIRALGRSYGWRIKGSRKADVVASLADALEVPEHVHQVWDALSPEERLAVALTFWGQGDVDLSTHPAGLSALAERFGASTVDEAAIDDNMHPLEEKGLLAVPPKPKRAWPDRVLASCVARWLPPMLKGIVPTHGELDRTDRLDVRLADPVTCTRSIGLMLNLIVQQNLSVNVEQINGGGAAAGFDSRLQRSNHGPSYRVQISRHFMAKETTDALAAIAGTVQVDLAVEALVQSRVINLRGKNMVVDADHALALAGETEAKQLAILAERFCLWTALPMFHELLRRDTTLSLWFDAGWLDTLHSLTDDLHSMTGLVLRVLCTLPNAEWVMMRDLDTLMRDLWPRFSASMARRPWYSRGEDWEVRATRRKRPDRWARIQGAYLRIMIAEALHWFGLADVALDAKGNLVAFRLQGLADLYLRRAETISPPHPPAAADADAPSEAVRIDLPHIRVAPMRVSAQALHTLGTIGKLDRASLDTLTYTIDPAVCYASFEAGTTLDEILAQWKDTMPLPMPAALKDQLAGYWGRYGEVQLYEDLTVIEFADDYALAEMRAVTNLDQHLIAEISPRMVIVQAVAVPTLIKQLEAAGYAPKQEQAKR